MEFGSQRKAVVVSAVAVQAVVVPEAAAQVAAASVAADNHTAAVSAVDIHTAAVSAVEVLVAVAMAAWRKPAAWKFAEEVVEQVHLLPTASVSFHMPDNI